MEEENSYIPSRDDIGKEVKDIIVVAVKKIYGNNGFVIFACEGRFTVKGNYGIDIVEGSSYKVSGKVGQYGKDIQISASSIELCKSENDSLKLIAAFLTDHFEGLGKKTAEKLSSEYKEKVLDVLLETPKEAAKNITGLSSAKALIYSETIDRDEAFLRALMDLRMLGLSKAQSLEAYDEFGLTASKEAGENPYRLLRCKGIGFETCEKIAVDKGIDLIDPLRFAGAVESVLYELHASSGSTYIDPAVVKTHAMTLLFKGEDYNPDLIDPVYDDALEFAVKNRSIVIYRFKDDKCEGCKASDDGARIALRVYFTSEADIKREIESFVKAKVKSPDIDKARKRIFSLAAEMDIVPDKMQEEALLLSMFQPICVITGGPGTGKTTITGILAEHFKREKISCEFCAPTGRAAKRLSEASGVKANTIHRLLQMNSDPGENVRFGRNKDNPIEARVIVVDEASMIDTLVFSALLKAIKKDASLILIGDPDQLPSVGAGNVLEDILSCTAVPRVRLQYVFRQKDESSIASNSKRILDGIDPIPNNVDFEIVRTDTDEEALIIVKDMYVPALRRGEDTLILSPTKQNVLGTVNINLELQSAVIGEDTKGIKIREGLTIHEGDRVMQVKNNYKAEYYDPNEMATQTGVFNGETGTVGEKDYLTNLVDIHFDDGRRIGYDQKMLADIELAYAVTVHKAQGCEFDHVIVALGKMNNMLSNRKLLYTAVTRGKKKVTVIDSCGRLSKMIASGYRNTRDTSLKDFLKIVQGRYET